MPEPAFIACAQVVAEAKRTNFLTMTNLVEKLRFERRQGEGVPVSIEVVAVWLRLGYESPDEQFESQFVVLPPGGGEMVIHESPFTFNGPPGSGSLRRFLFGIELSSMPGLQDGILRVEHRIRRQGDTEWLRQTYKILTEEVRPEPAAEQPPPGQGSERNGGA